MSTAKSIPEDGIMLREIVHVCVVVRDVEKTARETRRQVRRRPLED